MNDRQLLERARTAIKCLLVAVPVLSAAQLIAARAWTPVNTTQACHVALIASGWLALHGTPSRRRVLAMMAVQLALVGVFAVLVGSLRGDMPRTVVTVISAALAASVLMPWGARWQAAAAAAITAAMFGGAAVSDTLDMTPRDGGTLLAMLITTVFIAHVLHRQQRRLEDEQTQRRRHEEALAVSEAMFRAIFETAAIGVVRLDVRGTIIEANRALHRMLGFDDDALTGRRLRDITHRDDWPRDDGLIEDLLEGRCESYQADRRYLHRAGPVVWGHVTISAIQTLDGDPTVVAMIDDITARVQAEEQLARAKLAAEAAAEAKGRFLAIMSHEIRTPLNAMLGFNELLEATELDADQTHYVETVAAAGRHLSDIINDVLDFSKIESGAMELEKKPFDPRVELRRAVNMFEGAAARKKLALSCDIDDGVPESLAGDAKRIRQIVTNLVGNAIKFTETGSVAVRVRTGTITATRAIATIEVRDTGVGIDVPACETLFEPFVQADSSTTRRYGGTGLGLAICKQLAELMGGSIQVDSAVGTGSTFTVTLPVELARPADVEMASGRSRRAMRQQRETLRGLRVLVVEDDPTNLALIERLLTRVGCAVEAAHNGEEALVSLTRHNHPIVLMDIDMPVMDGREATRRIRTQFAPDAQPYIIAVTAYVSDTDRDRYLEEGMNDYLSKPIRPHELEAALERAVHEPASPSTLATN